MGLCGILDFELPFSSVWIHHEVMQLAREDKKSAVIGIVPALFFLVLLWTGAMNSLLQPFVRESSIYAGMIVGLILLFRVIPAVAVLSAGVAAAFAEKRRIRAAMIAFISSLLTMGAGIGIQEMVQERQAWRQFREAREQALAHPTQEAQELPLLDGARPITVVNQLEAGKEIILQEKSSLLVRAFVRDEIALPDHTVRAELMVFVPGTVERKVIAKASLHQTEKRSPDGRSVFEGSLSVSETHGATEGYLKVVGKDGIADFLSVKFAPVKSQ